METLLLSAQMPETAEIAANIIKNGGLVAIPTETVYGLGTNGLDEEAVAKIFIAKGRPQDNPLILHIADPKEMERFCHDIPPAAYALAEAFWPGPLTLVLPATDVVPKRTTGGLSTVGVRCPDCTVTRDIIRLAGVPIAAPSANRSGCPSPTTAEHVLRDMDGRIEMILDGGPCEIGLESTVIRWTEDGCEIMRPGAVTEFMLAEVAGSVSVAKAVIDPALAGDKPLSPGMKYKHYSPNAEVVLVDGDDIRFEEYIRSHIAETEAVVLAA